MDNDLRNLEKQAEQDPALIPKLQQTRDRLGLTASDADYYREYLQLCDEFMQSQISKLRARTLLSELNQKYQLLVGSNTLRQQILGEDLLSSTYGYISDLNRQYEDEAEGWSMSGVGC